MIEKLKELEMVKNKYKLALNNIYNLESRVSNNIHI